MGFSSRRVLTIGVVVLVIGIVVELGILASTVVLVSDLPERIQRIGAVAQAEPPSDQQTSPALDTKRPLSIQDAFDAPSARWDQSAVTVSDGALHTELFMPNAEVYTLWKGIPDDLEFDSRVQDVDLQVDITQTRGADDAYYGIRFRQNTTDSYILVAINARGYYRVVRSSFGVSSDLVPWTFSRHLRPGLNVANQLRVRATSTHITVSINGIDVNTVTDLSPINGQLTLAAYTTSGDYVNVAFDDVVGMSGGRTFSDSFSDPAQSTFSLGGSYTSDGVYHIISSSNVTVWQNPLPRSSTTVQNFRLHVDSTIVKGDATQIAYGVIFGDTGDFGYTMVLISGNGLLSVVRNDSNGNSQRYVEPTPLDMVVPGLYQTNAIDLTLVNNELQITINNTVLGSIQLEATQQGSVGMIVLCGETDVQVDFDNFSLKELSNQ